MLDCRACVLRCIRAIAGDAFATHSITLQHPLILTSRIGTPIQRHFANSAAVHAAERDVPVRRVEERKVYLKKGWTKTKLEVTQRKDDGRPREMRADSVRKDDDGPRETRAAMVRKDDDRRREMRADAVRKKEARSPGLRAAITQEYKDEPSEAHILDHTSDQNIVARETNSFTPRKQTQQTHHPHTAAQLKKELEFNKDPVKFANHVHYTLRCDNLPKALDLCRMASKSQNCVVAFNHIIDWMMKAGKVKDAIGVYNDMKKRGQYPDSYTYMMLLRGFPQQGQDTKQEVKEWNVAKAVSIYHSMTIPTSRVKPSIMHTNAALRVCSLASDMDALWGIASTIPEDGPSAADHKTYSILLAAVRFGAFGKEGDEETSTASVEQMAQARQQAVNEGRRIWQEVIAKWRAGQLQIDETLVVNMANLLLFGNRMEDWDDVLNLIAQTTNIQRLVAPIGSPERQTGHVPLRDQIEPLPHNVEDEEGWVPTPAANAFKPVSSQSHEVGSPDRASRLSYVQPGNGILNLLLLACGSMRIPKTAYAYWDTFTREHHVKPDRENFKELLRLLRLNRASARAVEVVKSMHSDNGIEPHRTTYRLALAVCSRDVKNVHLMTNATAIIDDMLQHMPRNPDYESLSKYLEFASLSKSVPRTLAAMKHLDQTVEDIQHRPQSGAFASGDIVNFYRTFVSTIDTVVRERWSATEEESRELAERRRKLTSYIGQALNNGEGRNPARNRFSERRETTPDKFGHAVNNNEAREQARKWNMGQTASNERRTTTPTKFGQADNNNEAREPARKWTMGKTASNERKVRSVAY